MSVPPSILGIVTARGGSKGVPRKNIRMLAGKPLLAYTAQAALSCQQLRRVILSTDDAEIAEVGRACGLDVPFLRPPELARDDTPTLPVLQHAVATLEAAGEHYDAVCLLQPTNPLRDASVIQGCIELFHSSEADSVVTVRLVPHEYNPHWVYFQDPSGFLKLSTGEALPIPRRQQLPKAFHREGSVYLMRRDVLMIQGNLFGTHVVGFPMDDRPCVNIDTLEDWAEAERLLSSRIVGA